MDGVGKGIVPHPYTTLGGGVHLTACYHIPWNKLMWRHILLSSELLFYYCNINISKTFQGKKHAVLYYYLLRSALLSYVDVVVVVLSCFAHCYRFQLIIYSFTVITILLTRPKQGFNRVYIYSVKRGEYYTINYKTHLMTFPSQSHLFLRTCTNINDENMYLPETLNSWIVP